MLEADDGDLLRAYRGGMGRMILKIAGIVLAVWLVFSVIGAILSMVKFFFILGLIAVVVMAVVTLVAKSAKAR